MADNSKIEWTDATWNPITGCSVISPGCTNCYAMKLAGGRMRNHPSRAGLTQDSKAGPVWNGQVRFNEDWLLQPLRWTKPRRIFPCAHGDLFHESVPDEWIDRVFAVMALAPQHIFTPLTKRADRMRDYMLERWQPAPAQTYNIIPGHPPVEVPAQTEGDTRRDKINEAATNILLGPLGDQDRFWTPDGEYRHLLQPWPLPNVHMGVSTEDQPRANERIMYLSQTPAAFRWISAEPLLAPIDFYEVSAAMSAVGYHPWRSAPILYDIDQVIVGGESGPRARDWDGFADAARQLRDQCKHSGTAFFMKQMPKKAPIPDDLMVREYPA